MLARKVAMLGNGPSVAQTWAEADRRDYDAIVCINSAACFPGAPVPFDYWVGVDTSFFRLYSVPVPPKAIVTWRSTFISLSRLEHFADWFPENWAKPSRKTDLIVAKELETFRPEYPEKVFGCSMEIAVAFICGRLADPAGCVVDCFGLDWGSNTNALGTTNASHTPGFFARQRRRCARHRAYWVGKGHTVDFIRVLPSGRSRVFTVPEMRGC